MLYVLKQNLEPKIHRADAFILKKKLREKTELVITVSLMKLQKDVYKLYINFMLSKSSYSKLVNVTL